jgi:hypothetical protein
MNTELIKLRALLDVRLMYHKLELAAALKHPIMGKAFANTLLDTDARLYRRLTALNKSLEDGNEG